MEIVLSDKVNSYYRHNNNILGNNGDFITAPEISQLFGEMIGLWCTKQYNNFTKKLPIKLVELGPGRGYLMRDILKVIKLIPDFYKSLTIDLVEINEEFIKEQKNTLSNLDLNISWYKTLKESIDNSANKKVNTIYIANEFFDALSIKQYYKNNNQWQEIVVKYSNLNDEFYFGYNELKKSKNIYLAKKYPYAEVGAIIEESINAKEIINQICSNIEYTNGSVLIIDYGYFIANNKRKSDEFISTLQSIKNHQFNPIFNKLGEADITSHVDFYSFTEEIKKYSEIILQPIITQSEFLISQGILIRKNLLQKNAIESDKLILQNQLDRLIGKNQMGNLFKVLTFHNY